ncbi:hypothetical protein ACFSKM_21390 [Ancylobacter dichloromethanicus]
MRNIALTGPYGSGKSSIIQSFLKKIPKIYTSHIPRGVRERGRHTRQRR